MSSKLRNWFNGWLLASLGLCAIYASALYLSRHPNVSDAYRAYYIDRTSDMPVWVNDILANKPGAASRLAPLELETPYASNSRQINLVGWAKREPSYVRTLGRQATLIVSPPQDLHVDGKYELVLGGTYGDGAQRIISSIGDIRVEKVYLNGDKIVTPLPPVVPHQQIVVLTLDLPQAQQGDVDDSRVRGFALQSLTLREVTP